MCVCVKSAWSVRFANGCLFCIWQMSIPEEKKGPQPNVVYVTKPIAAITTYAKIWPIGTSTTRCALVVSVGKYDNNWVVVSTSFTACVSGEQTLLDLVLRHVKTVRSCSVYKSSDMRVVVEGTRHAIDVFKDMPKDEYNNITAVAGMETAMDTKTISAKHPQPGISMCHPYITATCPKEMKRSGLMDITNCNRALRMALVYAEEFDHRG